MNFDQKCYQLLKKIPAGQVTTYREIAHKLGTRAYRAVGNAMNRNPDAPEVPCHRVICSDGKIGGYAGGTKKKINLLRQEGIEISQDKVVNVKRYLYRFAHHNR